MDIMILQLMFGITYMQGLVWFATAAATIVLFCRTWRMVYPADPKPVPVGQIEDAVLVYTWREAISMSQHYFYALGMMFLASVLVL